MRPCRRQRVEGAVDGAGFSEEKAALAEIIQREGRQRYAEPCDADRKWAEMAHVGVKRLAASDRQKSAADHGQRERPGVPEVGERRQGTEPSEDGGIPD